MDAEEHTVLSYLRDLVWWRDVAARAGRNVVQVLAPVLLLAAATGTVTGVDWSVAVDLAVSAVLVSVVKAVAGLTVGDHASWWERAVERVIAAASATLLGLITAPAWTAFHANWTGIGVAVAGSAVASVTHLMVFPPVTRDQLAVAA